MTHPRISVAMSVYDNALFLGEAIESILAQSFGDFEFLIVDDGSTDGSSEIIAGYAAADRRVRPIRQENRGLIASLNRLIGEARAPLIARMDGDDVALPDRFERQLAFLDAHSDHGVLGTCTTSIDEHGRPLGRGEPHPPSHEALVAALGTGPVLCHSSVIMRTELVRAVGGYRPLFRHCEDYDLWLRLSSKTRMCSLPERLMRYRFSDDQVSSRHVVAQQIGAAVAWLAHLERAAGRPDPAERLAAIPGVDELAVLDEAFGRPGVAAAVRDRVAPNLLYSEPDLRGPGFRLLLDHVRAGGGGPAFWRTTLRLAKIGAPARALRLAAALAVR